MTKAEDKRKHADFQSRYRRSFNFSKSNKENKLVLNEDGQLVLEKNT